MIQPTMTEARARWLEELSHGPANRHRSIVGFQCMKLGWTEWHYVDRDSGLPASETEARAQWGDDWWAHMRMDGERLTPHGWQVLRQHRERLAKLDQK